MIDVLLDAGVLGIELTLTTPGVLKQLGRIVASSPPHASIGVGTLTAANQATSVAEASGQFVVTPTVNRPLINEATSRGLASYPGAFTPTEVLTNWDAGATAVKIFSAATLGPSFIGHIHGPFPTIAMIPSGGISLDDIPAWITAGAVAVSLGGPL